MKIEFWVGFAGPFDTIEEAAEFANVAQGENFIEAIFYIEENA